jgi:Xaa-Pro aminopeptidase
MKNILRSFLILLLISSTNIAQQFPEEVFAARRAKLCDKIENGLLLMYGGDAVTRNGDINYGFRQKSDFYYLTGIEEPGVIMLLSPGADKKFVVFMERENFFDILFGGEGLTVQRAMTEFGADTAYTIDKFDDMFVKYARGKDKLFYNLKNEKFNSGFLGNVQKHGYQAPGEIVNPEKLIHEMRVFKDEYEIKMLSKSIDITCESIAEAMKAAEPGKTENELQGILEYVWRKNKVKRFGFPSIIASGKNTAILHYEANDGPISDGDLVMMDIGCEYGYYSADVTRTFPANGKFSKEQKQLYEIALVSQQTAIDSMKPGTGFNEINKITVNAMLDGLFDLGLISDKEKRWQVSIYYPFYFGHYLGLDTHDAGDQRGSSSKGRLFEPGMVIAVEPGLYINPENFEMLPELRKYLPGVTEEDVKEFMDKVRPQLEKYAYICVRAEDDVLITNDGHIVLSEKLPKSVEEIEKLMKEKSIFN